MLPHDRKHYALSRNQKIFETNFESKYKIKEENPEKAPIPSSTAVQGDVKGKKLSRPEDLAD